jgi:hypothetical protein
VLGVPLDWQLGSRPLVTTVSWATVTGPSPKVAWTDITLSKCGGQRERAHCRRYARPTGRAAPRWCWTHIWGDMRLEFSAGPGMIIDVGHPKPCQRQARRCEPRCTPTPRSRREGQARVCAWTYRSGAGRAFSPGHMMFALRPAGSGWPLFIPRSGAGPPRPACLSPPHASVPARCWSGC